MAKEWILNSAMNRFQLNFKRNVGPTSEGIRQCAPRTIDEWRDYYLVGTLGDVDENHHFTSIGNWGRRQKWRSTCGYVDQLSLR